MIRMIFRRYSGAWNSICCCSAHPCNAAGKDPSPRPGTQLRHTDSKAATSFVRPHSEPGVKSEAPDEPWLVSVSLAGQHRRRSLSGLDPGAAGADTTRCRPLRLPRACGTRRLSFKCRPARKLAVCFLGAEGRLRIVFQEKIHPLRIPLKWDDSGEVGQRRSAATLVTAMISEVLHVSQGFCCWRGKQHHFVSIISFLARC